MCCSCLKYLTLNALCAPRKTNCVGSATEATIWTHMHLNHVHLPGGRERHQTRPSLAEGVIHNSGRFSKHDASGGRCPFPMVRKQFRKNTDRFLSSPSFSPSRIPTEQVRRWVVGASSVNGVVLTRRPLAVICSSAKATNCSFERTRPFTGRTRNLSHLVGNNLFHPSPSRDSVPAGRGDACIFVRFHDPCNFDRKRS